MSQPRNNVRPIIVGLCDELLKSGVQPSLKRVAELLEERYGRKSSKETIASEVRLWRESQTKRAELAQSTTALSEYAIEVALLFEKSRRDEATRLAVDSERLRDYALDQLGALHKVAADAVTSKDVIRLRNALQLVVDRVDLMRERIEHGWPSKK